MAITPVNLTFDLGDLLDNVTDANRTKVWIETNIESDSIVDPDGNSIRLGIAKAVVGSDGTGSFTGLIPTNAATTSTAFQYRVWIDYPLAYGQERARGGGKDGRGKWNSGWFSLTATLDLADVVAEQYVPPTYVTQATQQLDAHAADLEADLTAATSGATVSADAAAASATEAGGYAQQARDISNIDTTDDAVDAALKLPGGKAASTLSASTADAISGTPASGLTPQEAVDARAGARVAPRGEDAISLGIPTDGTTDCAAAFAAIPANTGRVVLRGTFVCNSAFTLAPGVTLEGTGWRCNAQPAFGASAATWQAAVTGTKLVFTNPADAGVLIQGYTAGPPSHLRRLAIVGPGSGTERGLQVGEAAGAIRVRIEDVLVGNFAEGFYGSGMMNSTLNALYVLGCTTGVKLRNSSNGNAWTGLNVETCTTALDFSDSTGNTFQGGVVQGNASAGGTVALLGTTAHSNVFTGMYFENNGATWTFDLTVGAEFNQFNGLHLTHGAAGPGKVRIAGNQNIFLGPQTQFDLTLSGSRNILIGQFSGTITDTGSENLNLDTAGTVYKFGNRDIRIGSGKRYYFETAGSSSYIGRDSATGDTEIGTATGIIKRVSDAAPLLALKYAAKTANYTLTDLDHVVNVDATAGGRTMTLPTAVGRAGRQFIIRKSDASANAVTIATTSSQTINGAAPGTLTAQYQSLRFMSDGANWMTL